MDETFTTCPPPAQGSSIKKVLRWALFQTRDFGRFLAIILPDRIARDITNWAIDPMRRLSDALFTSFTGGLVDFSDAFPEV